MKNNPPMRKKASLKSLVRVVKMLFSFYPKLSVLTIFCIIFSAVTSSIPSIFIKQVIESIDKWVSSGDYKAALSEIIPVVLILAILYLISLICITTQTQLMAYMTQGFLNKVRCKLFDSMQNLPIRFFDTNKHGDIMSYYTNDIDTLRQLVSQAIPSLLQASPPPVTVIRYS